MSSVMCATVLKYLLAEFNSSQPEVYAHHKVVRHLITDENLRDFTLSDMDRASCEWVEEHDTSNEKLEMKQVRNINFGVIVVKLIG